MKLKNILIGIGLITSLQGVQSCIDDRGNYSYISNEELLPVTISGFEPTGRSGRCSPPADRRFRGST